MMRIAVVFAVIALIYPIASSGSTPAKTTPVFSSVTAEQPVMLAQESPQVAACRAEGARLQAATDAFNRRCN